MQMVTSHLVCWQRFPSLDEVYKVGGIQAIGAMTYGTKTFQQSIKSTALVMPS